MAKIMNAKGPAQKDVILSGHLSLQCCAKIRSSLLQALDEADTVNILFQDVEAVDLSLIQILCAAHRSALTSKKSLVVQKQLPDMLVQLIAEAGLQGHIGCSLGGKECCVWKN